MSQLRLTVPAGFHAVPDCIDCIGRIDRPMLALIVLDNQRQQIEAIGLGAARLWLVVEITFDLVERSVIIGFRAKRTNYFLPHVTVSGSMRSYSECVPTNFTSTRPNENET